jgi:rhodanese-related sulfurtransferase
MRRVSPREAHALLEHEGYVYLDVRAVPEFEQGHPVGAYNVPWLVAAADGMTPNPHFLAQVAAVLAEDRAIVVGCASGVRSLAAANCLALRGYTQVVEQRAGMAGRPDPFGRMTERGWAAEGLPVSAYADPGRSHREIGQRAGDGR